MARDITSGFETEIDASSLKPLILIKAEFDSGDLRIWTGYEDKVYNSETYTGAGFLLKISPVQETKEMRANNVNFELSNMESSIISLALTEKYRGRSITVWFGVQDESGLITNVQRIFKGKMDVMEIKDNGETGTLSLSAESDLQELRKKRPRRYTPEDQKSEFLGDLGLDFVPQVQEKDITWGNGVA